MWLPLAGFELREVYHKCLRFVSVFFISVVLWEAHPSPEFEHLRMEPGPPSSLRTLSYFCRQVLEVLWHLLILSVWSMSQRHSCHLEAYWKCTLRHKPRPTDLGVCIFMDADMIRVQIKFEKHQLSQHGI